VEKDRGEMKAGAHKRKQKGVRPKENQKVKKSERGACRVSSKQEVGPGGTTGATKGGVHQTPEEDRKARGQEKTGERQKRE